MPHLGTSELAAVPVCMHTSVRHTFALLHAYFGRCKAGQHLNACILTATMLLKLGKPVQHVSVSATMSRPRSSIWANQSTVSQQVLDPDEQPVTYRKQRSSLLPTPQSSRAPWLHTATVTAGRFKQPSRAQTMRSARQHSFPMQVTVCGTLP